MQVCNILQITNLNHKTWFKVHIKRWGAGLEKKSYSSIHGMFKYTELNLKTKVEPLWTIKPIPYTQMHSYARQWHDIRSYCLYLSFLLSCLEGRLKRGARGRVQKRHFPVLSTQLHKVYLYYDCLVQSKFSASSEFWTYSTHLWLNYLQNGLIYF